MITHQLNLNNSRNRHANRDFTSPFSPEVTATVRTFHRSFPDYSPTPLAKLSHLARRFGLANLWVKDESQRFGLNAFKVLGASYAIAHVIAQKDRQLNDEVSFALFQQAGVRAQLRETTLVTATDGNHGRAVAWAAQQLGCQAVIYMPRDTASARVAAVAGHGAHAVKIDGSYDEAVHLAAQHAEQRGWILLQDTAWPGYEEIPTRIMQGYLTILHEVCEQMAGEIPTHVFVQCGVGSFASALLSYCVELWGEQRPIFAVVEPAVCACYYQAMREYDGRPKTIKSYPPTLMAGLSCGEPSSLAWPILRDYADAFVACEDQITQRGMRILGNPLAGDDRVISGESGAVTLGVLAGVSECPEYHHVKTALQLNPASKVLLISTEGDTDPVSYRQIVWGEI